MRAWAVTGEGVAQSAPLFRRGEVAAHLERQALEAFEEAFRRYFPADKSKARSLGAPALLKGTSSRLGVVLLHGFLSVPAQMDELARYLNGKGLWVYQVRLPGHGTTPEDLAQRGVSEWVEAAELGHALMKDLCERVVLGGFSFGGGVALDCAGRLNGVAGAFAVCPPVRLWDPRSRFAPALTAWNRCMLFLRCRWGLKEFVPIVPERPDLNYTRVPVASLNQMKRFMRRLQGRLSVIQVPVLVLQAEGDPVVDPRGARHLFEMLGSRDKRYLSLPLRRHGVLAGEGAGEVHAAIGEFLERILEGENAMPVPAAAAADSSPSQQNPPSP